MSWSEETIRIFLEDYGAALSTGDMPAIVQSWELPAFVISEDGARAVTSAVEVAEFFQNAVQWYRSQGLVRTEGELERLEALGRMAVIEVRWAAYDADDIERSSERTRYVLRFVADKTPRIQVALMLPS